MATTKMTKREMFTLIKAEVKDNKEMVAFIDHELELLEKKNSSKAKKPTATQTANAGIKEIILDNMEPNRLYTITEMQKEFEELNDLSNQKISALVRQLVTDNLVTKIEAKRKSYFQIVSE